MIQFATNRFRKISTSYFSFLVIGISPLFFRFANGQSPVPPENRYAVVVGISNYFDKSLNLKFGKKDAYDFSNALIVKGKFKKENVKVLSDSMATRENIRKYIEGWLQQNVKKEDVVLIYFSGHGSQTIDNDNDEEDGWDECLVPYDFDRIDNSSAIVDDLFAYWIKNLKSNNILIVFDCCFSGGAAKQKGFSPPGAKGVQPTDDFSKDLSKEVPKKGTALIAASKSSQVSFESEQLSNGVFTHFLVKAIDAKSDNNLNYVIDEQELFNSTCTNTLKYSVEHFKAEQEPILISQLEKKMNLFYLDIPKGDTTSSGEVGKILWRVRNMDITKYKDERMHLLEKAYSIDPGNSLVNSSLAAEYKRIGNYEKALERLQYLYETKRGGPHIPDEIGNLCFKLHKYDQAISWFEISYRYIEDPDVLLKIGDAFLLFGDTAKALHNYNLSINQNPFQSHGYMQSFYIHYDRNDFATAYTILKKCMDVYSGDFETMYWLGQFERFYTGNISQGDSLLEHFQKNSGYNIAMENMKKAQKNDIFLVVEGKELKGKELYEYLLKSSLRIFPTVDELYMKATEFYSKSGKLKDRDDHLRKYLYYSKLNRDSLFVQKYKR